MRGLGDNRSIFPDIKKIALFTGIGHHWAIYQKSEASQRPETGGESYPRLLGRGAQRVEEKVVVSSQKGRTVLLGS